MDLRCYVTFSDSSFLMHFSLFNVCAFTVSLPGGYFLPHLFLTQGTDAEETKWEVKQPILGGLVRAVCVLPLAATPELLEVCGLCILSVGQRLSNELVPIICLNLAARTCSLLQSQASLQVNM